jgi:hypothetical protein
MGGLRCENNGVDVSLTDDQCERLLHPAAVWTRDQVLVRPSPIPAEPGVYAWYFDDQLPDVPLDGCHTTDYGVLLYVGISPKAPSSNGVAPSRQSLRSRIRYHYRGNAAGSTLRLTLGSLLADKIGIALRRVGSGQRLTFSEGEAALSEWMGRHARVCWVETRSPWLLETRLIDSLTLPLNLDQNVRSAFRKDLSGRRAEQRASARALPVLPK